MAFEEMRSARAAERKIADGVNDLGLSVSAGTGSFLERASHREGNEQRRQRPPPTLHRRRKPAGAKGIHAEERGIE